MVLCDKRQDSFLLEEVPGTARRPSSVRILSGIFASEAISGRQDRDFDPSCGSRQLPIIKTATGVDSW